ncbi:MAG: hypothetical protein AAB948_04060, partial [Patescibacteria group bacterium]
MTAQNILLGSYIVLVVLVAAFVAVFLHYWLRNRKYSKDVVPRIKNSVFFELQIPKETADQENYKDLEQKKQLISVAEQIFTTLSEAGSKQTFFGKSDYISFEIAA